MNVRREDVKHSYAKKIFRTYASLAGPFVLIILNNTKPKYSYTQNLFPIVQGGTHC
jgi:hypothetical protein